jgi:curved DNA-binding protein CbpA
MNLGNTPLRRFVNIFNYIFKDFSATKLVEEFSSLQEIGGTKEEKIEHLYVHYRGTGKLKFKQFIKSIVTKYELQTKDFLKNIAGLKHIRSSSSETTMYKMLYNIIEEGNYVPKKRPSPVKSSNFNFNFNDFENKRKSSKQKRRSSPPRRSASPPRRTASPPRRAASPPRRAASPKSADCPCKHKTPVRCTSKKDYFKQSLIFHPDKNTGCQELAKRKFQELADLCSHVK